MTNEVVKWWVLYHYTSMADLYHGEYSDLVATTPGAHQRDLWEPTIARLMTDLPVGRSCAHCKPRRLDICPGIEMHVAMVRDEVDLTTGHMVHLEVIELPASLEWRAAMKTIKQMIWDGAVHPEK